MFFAIFADQRNLSTNCTPVGLKTFVPVFHSLTIEKYHFSSLSSHTVRIFLFHTSSPSWSHVPQVSLKFLFFDIALRELFQKLPHSPHNTRTLYNNIYT